MPVMSVEVAAAASVFYVALLIKARKGKKKKDVGEKVFRKRIHLHL